MGKRQKEKSNSKPLLLHPHKGWNKMKKLKYKSPMTYKLTVTTLALTAITSTVAATHAKPDTEHPHIVLILCDDMGFSDLSCYGGEIHTPNID